MDNECPSPSLSPPHSHNSLIYKEFSKGKTLNIGTEYAQDKKAYVVFFIRFYEQRS
jgi:hypothetical protein